MTYRLVFFLLLALSLPGCRFYFTTFSLGDPAFHRLQAEELEAAGKYDEAIAEYERHIEARLKNTLRPDTENPYFYTILIGDLHLQAGRPDDALTSYLEAQEKSVSRELVADRLRLLGKYYAEQDQLETAIELLSEYRHLDPLLYDADIDRIHKEIVRREQEPAEVTQ